MDSVKMEYLDIAKKVLELEAKAITEASQKLTAGQVQDLVHLLKLLNGSRGSLIFCGVGKSGYIGQKLSSTFCSLGLPSYFLHPVEALHGDLGRVSSSDCIVFISNSGTTEEIIKLLPFLVIKKEQRIGLLGNENSPIAESCGLVFDCSVEKEACKNNQAPTTSSTLALAVGDAMAVIYEYLVGLSKEGFAFNHPGGLLGKSLRVKVSDIMVDASRCPILLPSSSVREAVLEMTKLPVGGCAIVEKGKFLGILVDGDIRRFLTQKIPDLDLSICEVMNKNPVSITPEVLAIDALYTMENRQSQIGILPVLDEKRGFLGFIRLHDILREGISLKVKAENISL
jgi:arabinose-5-phosphate isomerase